MQAQDAAPPTGNGLVYSIASQYAYDDNLLRQQTSTTGSRMLQLNPRVRYQMQASSGSYYVSYDLNHISYLDSSQDSVTNQVLGAGIEERLNSYNKIGLDATYNYGYEPRGVGFNEAANALQLSKPTLLTVEDVVAKYQLGQDGRGLRLLASAGHRSTNRDSPLIVDNSRDYNEDYYTLALKYRVGSRTDVVAEYRDRNTNYPTTPTAADGSLMPLDSEEKQYLAGIDLEATAKTTGKLRVGTSSRDFKWKSAQWSDSTPSQTTQTAATNVVVPSNRNGDFFWEFAAVWAPRTYSRFEFNTRTSTREALGVGSFVTAKDYTLVWSHQWTNRLRTRADFTLGTDDYRDSSRIDDRKSYNLRMEYDFTKKLNLGVGYTFQGLKSNLGRADYDKSIYYIFINYRNR